MPAAAQAMGLAEKQICVMIHSGCRGLGYQVCDDALRDLRGVPQKYGIELPDRQLACAPVNSTEGKRYLGAMRAAANFAWCNRQLLMWQAREVFSNDVRPLVGRFGHGSDLRRGSQHRQVRAARSRRHSQTGVGPSQGSDARRFRRGIPRFQRPIKKSASRCSFPATWAERVGFWSVSAGSMAADRSAPPATAPAA